MSDTLKIIERHEKVKFTFRGHIFRAEVYGTHGEAVEIDRLNSIGMADGHCRRYKTSGRGQRFNMLRTVATRWMDDEAKNRVGPAEA